MPVRVRSPDHWTATNNLNTLRTQLRVARDINNYWHASAGTPASVPGVCLNAALHGQTTMLVGVERPINKLGIAGAWAIGLDGG